MQLPFRYPTLRTGTTTALHAARVMCIGKLDHCEQITATVVKSHAGHVSRTAYMLYNATPGQSYKFLSGAVSQDGEHSMVEHACDF